VERSAVLSWKCFSTEESWAVGPTQGDEKRLLFQRLLSPFVMPTEAKRRDLRFSGLSWRCIFDSAKRRACGGAAGTVLLNMIGLSAVIPPEL
jgi:hypothetical protein